jgi:two-component system NtrC family sensor kinase
VVVSDNGVGIAPENLMKIFQHGFTTRAGGHGFGLHSSANTANELGGSLVAHSDGLEKGATFILELPLRTEENSTTVKGAN